MWKDIWGCPKHLQKSILWNTAKNKKGREKKLSLRNERMRKNCLRKEKFVHNTNQNETKQNLKNFKVAIAN